MSWEWSHGVDPWSEMLERKRNIYSGGEISLVLMDAIVKHVTNLGITHINNGN